MLIDECAQIDECGAVCKAAALTFMACYFPCAGQVELIIMGRQLITCMSLWVQSLSVRNATQKGLLMGWP